MIEPRGIVVDLDLCVGCYACEVACKQENNIPISTAWLKVVPVGPQELNEKLQLDFIPVINYGCTLCKERLGQNLEPRCVENCPTQALKFFKSTTELLEALHSKRRLQVCKLEAEVPAFA